MPKKTAPPASIFSTHYPHLAEWVANWGWIELGRDDYSTSQIRVLDIGGMVWEAKRSYSTIDAALSAAEKAVAAFIEENG